MKNLLLVISTFLTAAPASAQVPEGQTVCISCGADLKAGEAHTSACIYSTPELLEDMFASPAADGAAADTFCVNPGDKAQVLLFRDSSVKKCALGQWDADRDGCLTVGEAEKADRLNLMFSNRKNIFSISTYADLRFFPNLEYLHAGYSNAEVIDLSHNLRLREVNLCYALTAGQTQVKYAEGLVMVQRPSADPWKRAHGIIDSEDHQVYVNEAFIDKSEDLSAYRDRSDSIFIQNEEFLDRCFMENADENLDGIITAREAQRVQTLDFNSREMVEGPRYILDFSELRYFPNLRTLRTGTTYIDTLDLSGNPCLQTLDASRCRALTTIVLPRGCKPKILMPQHPYKGKDPKVKRAKQ